MAGITNVTSKKFIEKENDDLKKILLVYFHLILSLLSQTSMD